jgi:hypothetical protein
MSVLPCPTREYNEMDQPGGARQKSWNWDHSPVLCTLDPSANTTPKGPGYRRMNPTMFTRNDVREDLKNILLTAKQLELKWHEFKDILFEYLHEMQVMNKWLDRVDIAWNELLLVRDSEGISDETLKIYTNRWLNALEKDAEMKKALGDRRRDLFLELPSRYLSKILKSRAADRTVKEIKDKQGQIHTDTAGILKSFQEYYTELYAEKPIIEASLHRLLTAWPAEPAAMQDIPNLFTKEELVKLIKDSDGFKSPGLDGAPYGLYQLEPDLFADFLIQQYNDVWSGYMAPPQGWSRSIITTLFKGGSLPLDQISSRRPISLLDTDYKLFGKLVATRMQAALNRIILPSQNGFVKGRSIFSNILALNEAIAQILRDDFDFPQLLLVDCEKAFDRVSHQAIKIVLEHIGFPALQADILLAILNNSVAQVMVNGFLTQDIPLHSGVRQGCPMSPLLFILVIECLNRAVYHDTDALGIVIAPGVDVRGLFFADDIAFMARSWKSHQRQIQLLTLYEEGTAAKVNKRKSALFSFRGLPPNSLSDFSPGKNDGERYLGILFGLQGIIPQLPTLVESIVQSMDHWKSFPLSERGRAVVLNCYLLPRLFYVSRVEDISSATLARLNRAMRAFIWKRNSNTAHFTMSLKRMERSLECGGIGLTSVSMRIKAQRIWLVNQAQTSESWWAVAWRHQLNTIALPHHHWSSQHLAEMSRSLPAGSLIRSSCSALSNTEMLEQIDSDASLRDIYHLISPRNHMTLTATQRQRAEDPDLQINYKQAFNKIWKTPATRRIQSTFWKMLSNALPRAPHGKQACPHCGDPETTYHIFWDCTEALLVYVHTSSIWSKWTGDRIHLFSPMDIFNMGAPTQDVSSVELVFRMAVNHLIWRRRCQALHLEPPLHEPAYESFLKIELERAVNMASTKIYDIQLFLDEWLYLDLFDLINGVSHLRADL